VAIRSPIPTHPTIPILPPTTPTPIMDTTIISPGDGLFIHITKNRHNICHQATADGKVMEYFLY
jgi:hypothetical protein